MTGDPLRAMLGQWWREQRLPATEHLTDAQAQLVLDRIETMEWWGRPYQAEGA